ncbi:amiloride-sensitive sodium channel subunit gamma-like [Pecten maximus]|uniref:amiloride-sensitive sodium channel subunit gamma-like n=1 Tax=Pecten maximus TaxID=6579 RepID=UPI001458535B|nr:amiloride-sensitive sodium channel subunit gamma-like [Pecten maximus]
MFQPFKLFMEYTTVHGLGRIASVKHIIHKLLWLALFLASIGMCIYQVTRLGQQFTSNPISTTISLEHGPQEFPAVIICNLNPASFSKIVGIKEFHHILAEASDHSGILLEKFKNASGMTNPLPNFTHTSTFNLNQYHHPLGMAKKLFEARLANMSTEDLTAINEEFQRFIVDCKYYSKNCSVKDFDIVRDGGHGICYKKIPDLYYTESAGPEAGLEVIVSVLQSEYIPYVAESTGVRIIIQDDATEVFADNGFNLPTGFDIDISVAVSETNRVSGPDERCEENTKWQRKLACMRNCSIAYASEYCECSPYHGYSDEIERICMTVEEMNCFKKETEIMMRSSICTACKFPCFEKTYKTSVSMARWPSDAYTEILATDYDWGEKIDKIRADYMRIRVYFSSLTKEIIKEELSYTSENFVSDIGGQLGLWAGLSVLSLAEVVELIVIWVTHCCKKKNRTGQSDIPDKMAD